MRSPSKYETAHLPKGHKFYSMSSNGTVLKHRLVVAEHMNRTLGKNETVLFKDENSHNTDISNLQLLPERIADLVLERRRLLRQMKSASERLVVVNDGLFNKGYLDREGKVV